MIRVISNRSVQVPINAGYQSVSELFFGVTIIMGFDNDSFASSVSSAKDDNDFSLLHNFPHFGAAKLKTNKLKNSVWSSNTLSNMNYKFFAFSIKQFFHAYSEWQFPGKCVLQKGSQSKKSHNIFFLFYILFPLLITTKKKRKGSIISRSILTGSPPVLYIEPGVFIQ